jgi:hypothetical protein
MSRFGSVGWPLCGKPIKHRELEVSSVKGCDGKIKAALCGGLVVADHRSLSRFRRFPRGAPSDPANVSAASAQWADVQGAGFTGIGALCR